LLAPNASQGAKAVFKSKGTPRVQKAVPLRMPCKWNSKLVSVARVVIGPRQAGMGTSCLCRWCCYPPLWCLLAALYTHGQLLGPHACHVDAGDKLYPKKVYSGTSDRGRVYPFLLSLGP
jgi:hypothetical protein